MIKAKSRIKKQVRSRDVKGKFTSRMSGKERLFILAILLGTMLWGYSNHSNYNVSADTSVHIVEPGEPEPDDNPVQIQEVIVPEPKEVTEKQQIINYIVEVFGEDAPDAFNVLRCENKGLNPNAVNYNSNGSIDEGIFQINNIHRQANMQNWKLNVDYAYKLFSRQGWTPWACSHRVDVKPFYL